MLKVFKFMLYLYAQKRRNTVVNAVAHTAVTAFGRGVYVYTIKCQQKTRNTVLNAVAHKALIYFGGRVVCLHKQIPAVNNISGGKCSCI